MTSNTVFVVAAFAFHFFFASALELKRLTRITLSADIRTEDNSSKDPCSACEADASASWDVKCHYKTCGLCSVCNSDKTEPKIIEKVCSVCEADARTSWDVKCNYKTCGLCSFCNSDKTEDETIEKRAETLEKADTADAAATLKEDSHEEEKTYEKLCSVCEADVSASWAVKCHYKSCGLCPKCGPEDETIEKSAEIPVRAETEDAAATQKEDSHEEEETYEKLCSACEADVSAPWAVKCHYKSCGLCSKCGPDKVAADVSTQFASQVAMTHEDATQCQGADGKMYDDGAAYECSKGKTWQCAHGEWKYMGECGETKEKTVEVTEEVEALAPDAAVPKKPDFSRPRMYVAEGCDESTASTTHAVRILALHGINAGIDDDNREALMGKPEKVLPRMKTMYANYKSHHMALMFKSILHRDLEVTTSKELANMGGGTLAVYVTRRNHLDQVVCMIRDCFVNTDKDTTTYGYAVNNDGTPTNMCFERRATEGDAGKAKLRVREHKRNGEYRSYLEESLQKSEQRVADGVAALKKAGYAAPTIASEDLEAFQAGGDNNLQTSLKAWTELLKAWEVEVDIDKLTKYLSSYANTYTPKSQRETIHNFKEVVNEINRLGRRDLVHAD